MTKKVFIISIFLVFGLASMCFAHSEANGIGYYALEVPADVTITVDGDDSDWAWFDPSFIYGPDDMQELRTGEMPPKSDIDIAARVAWTGTDRDNKWYGFYRVTDDTLIVTATAFDDGWRDDDLEAVPDPDHSGGHSAGESGIQMTAGQQFTMHVPVPGVYESPYGNGGWWLRYKVDPEMHWVDELADSFVGTVPPGAGTGSTNVIVNYEFGMPLWDEVLPEGEAASTRHMFAAGETVGFAYTLNEADNAEEGRSHQITTAGGDNAHGNQDLLSSFTLLTVGEYDRQAGTAVESNTWGKIKATFSR